MKNLVVCISLILCLLTVGCSSDIDNESTENDLEDHSVNVVDIQIESDDASEQEDSSQTSDDKLSEYPYNIENAEDASGYVYPENLIASRDWGADETDEMAEYLMNTVPDDDIELKQLIALVILNRVWTPDFPDTVQGVIEDLIREKNIEYDDRLEPTYECYEAIGNIQYEGWNESQDALYYTTRHDIDTKNEYDSKYEQVLSYGDYIFYK